jgi:hypothetical protein
MISNERRLRLLTAVSKWLRLLFTLLHSPVSVLTEFCSKLQKYLLSPSFLFFHIFAEH